MVNLINFVSRFCFYLTLGIIFLSLLGSITPLEVAVDVVILTLNVIWMPILVVLSPTFFVLGLVFLNKDGSGGIKNVYYTGLPLIIMVVILVFPNAPIYKFKPVHNIAVSFSTGNRISALYIGRTRDQAISIDQNIEFLSPAVGDVLDSTQNATLQWRGSSSLLKYLSSIPEDYDVYVIFSSKSDIGSISLQVHDINSADSWPLWDNYATGGEGTATWDLPRDRYKVIGYRPSDTPITLKAKLIFRKRGCMGGVACDLDLPVTRKIIGESGEFTLKF